MPLFVRVSSYINYNETVSNSKAYLFQKCKEAFSLKYILKVKPLAKDAPLESWLRMFRGTVIHAGLEAALVGADPKQYIADEIAAELAKGLRQEQQDALPEVQDSSQIIVDNLVEWLPISDFEPVMHNGKPVVEMQLSAPLEGWPGGFNGYVDALVRHKPTGRVVCLDWKTKQTFGAEGDEQYQTQLPLYLYALRHMGIAHVNTFALIEIKSTPPKRARKLREDTGTFDGIRESVDGQFRFVPRYVTDAEIQNNWNQFAKMALSMSRFTSHDYSYRSRSPFSCKGCEYNLYCTTATSNGDVTHILRKHYNTPPASLKILTEG